MPTAISSARITISASAVRPSAVRTLAVCALVAAFAAGAAGEPSVTFDPSASLPTEPTFTVDLRLDCDGQPVHGVEIVASYEASIVTLDAIVPGPWLSGAAAPFYFFDYTPQVTSGTIRFASAILGGTHADDAVLAICHFSMNAFGVSPLQFQDVDVRDAANLPLVVTPSTGDYILLDPVIGAERSSFGAVKALFR